jgi:hypothetical protein
MRQGYNSFDTFLLSQTFAQDHSSVVCAHCRAHAYSADHLKTVWTAHQRAQLHLRCRVFPNSTECSDELYAPVTVGHWSQQSRMQLLLQQLRAPVCPRPLRTVSSICHATHIHKALTASFSSKSCGTRQQQACCASTAVQHTWALWCPSPWHRLAKVSANASSCSGL